MQGQVTARLREAIATGEVLGIRYHGGSQPGAFRQIKPIRIEGEQVRARCYTSNAVKVFAVAKIELRDAAAPTDADVSAAWAPLHELAHHFATIDMIAAHFRPQLEAKGWHVELGPIEDGEAFAVYARFKNGKPRRTPAAVLSYEARAYDLVETADGSVERRNERARVRPWTLRAHGKSSSWGRVDRAVEALMQATGLTAPDNVAPCPDRPEAAGAASSMMAPVAASTEYLDPARSPPMFIWRAWRWLRHGSRKPNTASV